MPQNYPTMQSQQMPAQPMPQQQQQQYTLPTAASQTAPTYPPPATPHPPVLQLLRICFRKYCFTTRLIKPMFRHLNLP